MAFVIGVIALGAGWLVAGHERRGPGPLARANLLPPDHASVEAVAGGRVTPAVAPVVAALLSTVGVFALGTGWSGFHHRGLDGALLATLAPERVALEGTLKTDPRRTTVRLVRDGAGEPSGVAGRCRDPSLVGVDQRK